MQKLKLIDGEFSASEFKETLTNLFLNKIKFHERKNFSSQERFGTDEPTTTKRIAELNQNIEQLFEIFSEAEKNNQKLILFSDIQIRFIDSKICPKNNTII